MRQDIIGSVGEDKKGIELELELELELPASGVRRSSGLAATGCRGCT